MRVAEIIRKALAPAMPGPTLTKTATKEERWKPSRVRVPGETRQGLLRTSDGEIYHRDPTTNVIRRVRPLKVKGKAMVKAIKKRRARSTGRAKKVVAE